MLETHLNFEPKAIKTSHFVITTEAHANLAQQIRYNHNILLILDLVHGNGASLQRLGTFQ